MTLHALSVVPHVLRKQARQSGSGEPGDVIRRGREASSPSLHAPAMFAGHVLLHLQVFPFIISFTRNILLPLFLAHIRCNFRGETFPNLRNESVSLLLSTAVKCYDMGNTRPHHSQRSVPYLLPRESVSR